MGNGGGVPEINEEPAELEAFCRTQFPRLVQLLSLYCGDTPTAEDLAQETLARVWQRWRKVSQLDAPELWARRVAINLAASWHRRRVAGGRAITRAAALTSVGASTTHPVDDGGPSGTLEILSRLPGRQRAAVVLRFYEDLSVAETAQVMGCREGTVKALTSQALDRLRQLGISADAHDD
jgi:RNA polymerase sigma-70 factor (sigma-E family)